MGVFRSSYQVAVTALAVLALLPGGLAAAGSPQPTAVEAAAALPAGFEDTLVASVGAPTAIAFTPDRRLLIASQDGTVRVVSASGTLQSTPVLDISAKVCPYTEWGLMGIAVDPSFATNGHIYLFYTFMKFGDCPAASATSPVNRVSRFQMTGNVADPATESVLIDNIPAPGANHNAGDLQFGKDGNLYISTGDGRCDWAALSQCGGSNNNAPRRLNGLAAKILRITPDGGIPVDNPFQGAGTARCNVTGTVATGTTCRETYAWGLRNPFRIAFDPNAATTKFRINDVGEGQWEEIDEGAAGADYGWNIREGHCAIHSSTNCGPPAAGMTNPIFDYSHGSGCSSITGGAFVPNGIWPAEYDNTYLFGDYVCGKIFRLQSAGGTYTATDFVTGLGSNSAVAMTFGPHGSTKALYYTSYAGGGQVRRIAYVGSVNRTPTAVVAADPTSGPAPLTVDFDGSDSSDPDAGDTLTYVWDFDDGPVVETATPSTTHTYSAPGIYDASLQVRDNHGAVATAATVRIDVGNTAPVPTIEVPGATDRFRVGQVVTLRGSAVDAQDGTLADSRLSWEVRRHHGTLHFHPFLPPTTGNNVGMPATPPPEDLDTTTTSYLEIRLTATDSNGLSATTVREFRPNLVDMRLRTTPSGLRVDVNGVSVTAPYDLSSWEAWAFPISASRQTDGMGRTWIFDSWSDGGAASHTVTTGTTAATFTANFHENRAPVATGGAVSAVEDVAKTVTLQATDADNDVLSFNVSRAATNGTTGPPSGNQVVYTPAPQYHGGDSFGFTATDGTATSAEANVALTVTEVNDSPSTGTDSATTPEDTAVSIDVLANDGRGPSNESSQTLTIDSVADPSHGVATIQSGQVRFTPDANYFGGDTFTYRICDNGTTAGAPDRLCANGTISVTINPVNDAPVAANDTASTSQDASAILDVLTNDLPGPPNEAAQLLSLGTISDPAHGTAVAEAGKIRYTPDAGYQGPDSIVYQACDNGSPVLCSGATVSVTVTDVNQAPTVSAGSGSTPEDVAATLTLSGSDPDGDPLTFTIVSGPSRGTLATPIGSSVLYTPSANSNGPDSFTFKAGDGSLESGVATFSITVTPVNDPPVPAGDTATTAEDTSLVVDAAANDSPGPADEAGQSVHVSAVGSPAHGTASLIGSGPDTGKVRYTPSPDYNGPDTFAYEACDNGTTNGTPDPKCAGSAVAFSFSAFHPPLNTGAPEIAGAVRAGGVVRADSGAWSPALLGTEYQWLRCTRDGRHCAQITGARSASYVVRVADIARRLRVRVTARNRFGSSWALSSPTPLITSPVVISRIVFDTPGAAEDEWITLRNVGPRATQLRNWTIGDADGNVFRFGRLALAPGRSVTVDSGPGRATPFRRFWNHQGLVWDDRGEQASLKTSAGVSADRCRYRASRSGSARC